MSAAAAATTSSNASNNNFSSLSNQFSPTLRLLKVYEVENILAYPIGKEPCLIQIPSYSNLSMVLATNMPDILSYSNYLNLVLSECEKLAPEYLNMINYLPHTPPPSVIGEGNLNQPDSSIRMCFVFTTFYEKQIYYMMTKSLFSIKIEK
jgi:hypothetical protein